jgi:predicted MFS family arabinose efflux permease
MFGWGLAFWISVPRVLGRVAEWSLAPEERVGDAQSVMALGRAGGPAIGAALVGPGHFEGLAIFAGAGLLSTAGVVAAVERYRRGKTGPTSGHNLPGGE